MIAPSIAFCSSVKLVRFDCSSRKKEHKYRSLITNSSKKFETISQSKLFIHLLFASSKRAHHSFACLRASRSEGARKNVMYAVPIKKEGRINLIRYSFIISADSLQQIKA